MGFVLSGILSTVFVAPMFLAERAMMVHGGWPGMLAGMALIMLALALIYCEANYRTIARHPTRTRRQSYAAALGSALLVSAWLVALPIIVPIWLLIGTLAAIPILIWVLIDRRTPRQLRSATAAE